MKIITMDEINGKISNSLSEFENFDAGFDQRPTAFDTLHDEPFPL